VLRLLLQILQSPTHDEFFCQNQKAKGLITGLSLEFLVTSQQLIKLLIFCVSTFLTIGFIPALSSRTFCKKLNQVMGRMEEAWILYYKLLLQQRLARAGYTLPITWGESL
jgi:hypothetical protein